MLEMRTIDLRLMNHLPMLEVVGDDGNRAFSGEPERKGTPKFSLFLTPLDVVLLQDASGDDAHHQDCLVSPGVASTIEFFLDAGEMLQWFVEDGEQLRSIKRGRMKQGFRAVLEAFLYGLRRTRSSFHRRQRRRYCGGVGTINGHESGRNEDETDVRSLYWPLVWRMASSGVLIFVEDVARLLRRVVVAVKEDEGDGLLLNVERYMDHFHVGWAKVWAAAGLLLGCVGPR
jgi:hypothetical protein